MYNHAPQNYRCPFCAIARNDFGGIETRAADIVYRDEQVSAFVGSLEWPRNPGNVIVIPNAHRENIYEIDDGALGNVYALVKKVSLAFKLTYRSAGVSTRQHNEPAGNQEVWHFHAHVLPRYDDDHLYRDYDHFRRADPQARAEKANLLRKYFQSLA